MQITLNGEAKDVEPGTIRDLLVCLNLGDQFVAVEQNRELIPKRNHAEVTLQEGDEIEIVSPVGGG